MPVEVESLSRRRSNVVRALTRALFDDGRGGVPDDRVEFTVRELGSFARSMGLQSRLALRAALALVQLAPLLLLGRPRRFTSLGREPARRCLERLERSRLGLALVLLKTTLCFVYFEHPAALAEMGYDGLGLRGPAWPDGGRSPVLRALPVLGERVARRA